MYLLLLNIKQRPLNIIIKIIQAVCTQRSANILDFEKSVLCLTASHTDFMYFELDKYGKSNVFGCKHIIPKVLLLLK